ncbi:hypothetical protein LTR29_015906 [Friedmanniomyces endolithicus]|nr:hypothetical protein LTR29_015906 [Friedmanniomyces endolithicus]
MFLSALLLLLSLATTTTTVSAFQQAPLLYPSSTSRNISSALFADLEELARIVDISYCVSPPSLGILHPFRCLSHCKEFPKFSLVTTWNTGPLLSDSCGYIALDHGKERVIVAFRGTYSLANTVVDLSTIPQTYVPYPGSGPDDDSDGDDEPKCEGCKVHMGFHTAWLITNKLVLPDLERHLHLWPHYKLTLVGHSLGGAVAALAGLELLARGYDPTITTFGEPRVGNQALARYIDQRFHLQTPNRPYNPDTDTDNDTHQFNYRRVTHINDPVPLLPLTEWGFASHAGEIYIRKPELPPSAQDLEYCVGDNDPRCIAGQDSTVQPGGVSKRDLLASVANEVQDVLHEPWGVPARYRLWELFFAHRDYFWRLGLCVPGGDPLGGGGRSRSQTGRKKGGSQSAFGALVNYNTMPPVWTFYRLAKSQDVQQTTPSTLSCVELPVTIALLGLEMSFGSILKRRTTMRSDQDGDRDSPRDDNIGSLFA